MKLKPSLKEKKWYLLLEIKEKERKKAEEKIDKILLKKLPVFDYARAGPIFILTKTIKGKAYVILSISVKSLERVKGIFSKEKIPCLLVSGTIKKVREKLQKRL